MIPIGEAATEEQITTSKFEEKGGRKAGKDQKARKTGDPPTPAKASPKKTKAKEGQFVFITPII